MSRQKGVNIKLILLIAHYKKIHTLKLYQVFRSRQIKKI